MYQLTAKNIKQSSKNGLDLHRIALSRGNNDYSISRDGRVVYQVEHITVKRCL